MRTGYRFLSKFGKLCKRKVINPTQGYFLYSLLFQDDLYSSLSNRSSNRLSMDSKKESTLSNGYSIISIKRLINAIRQQDLSGILSPKYDSIRFGGSNYMSFDALSKGICSVLEIILSPRIEPLLMGEIHEWKSSQSNHSVFPFLEDRLRYSNYILNTEIPHTLHSEVFIRMFRQRIKDAPFLHLPRLIFLIYTSSGFSIDYSFPKSSLTILVWNFYMYEIESLVVPLWNQFSGLRRRNIIPISDHNNLLQKQNQVGKSLFIGLIDYAHNTRSFCIHYGRYENRSLVILKGTKYSVKRWIYYILKFTESNSHHWLHCYRICVKRLSRNCVLFLGYILGVRSRINEVQVRTMKDSYITVSINNESLYKVPIILLIRYMVRENFCDNSGRPISRSAWTTLTDDEILRRFVQIWKIILFYYSGSKNRNNLYRLKYILRFSCGKTLACKHKGTIRTIQRRFDLRVFLNNLSSLGDYKDYKSSPFSPTKNILKNQRFWYLEITQFSLLDSI
uniref:intron maturase n=1 Tax=Trichomanes auriculatum TaxID=381226 RepID=UPI0028D820A3|nr:intron maturase [Vandenboschia auriculata]ALO81739.1 intron maturase [Vandenboschia auriculata]